MYGLILRGNTKTDLLGQSMPISKDTPKTDDSSHNSERPIIKLPFRMDSFIIRIYPPYPKLFAWKYHQMTQMIQMHRKPSDLLSLKFRNSFLIKAYDST